MKAVDTGRYPTTHPTPMSAPSPARDLWHFPRTEDAARILQTLAVGLVAAVAIIEPRRRGKTTFLLEDLIPAARAAGYLAIYLNLASAATDIERLVAATITEALEADRGIGGHLKSLATSRVKSISAKAKMLEAEIDATVDVDANRPVGAMLNEAFALLARSKKPVLILLDEMHRLADASHHDLSWSLRSLLDTHRNKIKVVATSSSAASFEMMVTGEKKAFSRWFTRLDLAPLDKPFAAHLYAVVKKHFPKHEIRLKDIESAFERLGRSPKFTRDYLNARILMPQLGHDEALETSVAEAAKDSGFTDEFDRLAPLQKAVLLAIGTGVGELFGEASLASFAKAIGAERLGKPIVQRALKSLGDRGWIVRQDRGDYRLADSLFEQWLNERLKAGQLPAPGSAPS